MGRLKVIILGGTGIISTGITEALLQLGHEVIHFNRGMKGIHTEVETVIGDRYQLTDLQKVAARNSDVVIDMLSFHPEHAKQAVTAFKGKTEHFIFCSTCCVYRTVDAVKPLTEESSTESHMEYGVNKYAAEEVMRQAEREGAFALTVFRPSHVYGGDFFINQLDFDGFSLLRRIVNDAPVLLGDSGTTTWQACHRLDAGRAFAYAAGRTACYGQTYNLSYQEILTWRNFYEWAAEAIGRTAKLYTLPADVILSAGSERFGFYRDVSRFHAAMNVDRLYHDIPEFAQTISFAEGVRLAWDVAVQNELGIGWQEDTLLEQLLEKATPLSPLPEAYRVKGVS